MNGGAGAEALYYNIEEPFIVNIAPFSYEYCRRMTNSTPALKRDRSSMWPNDSHFLSPKPSPLMADRYALLLIYVYETRSVVFLCVRYIFLLYFYGSTKSWTSGPCLAETGFK